MYTVRPETKDGPICTLHRDLLLPCPFQAGADDPNPLPDTPPHRPKTRSQTLALADSNENLDEDEEWELSQAHILPPPFAFRSEHSAVTSSLPQAGSTTVSSAKNSENPADAEPSALRTTLPGNEETTLPANEGTNLPANEENNLLEDGDSSADPEASEPGAEYLPEGVQLTCDPDSLPGEPELPGQAEASPSPNKPLLIPTETLAEVQNSPDIAVESDPVVRHSNRQRQPPNRLQYSVLGNSLISVVQTLFHGLVDAYSEALGTSAANDLVHPPVYEV